MPKALKTLGVLALLAFVTTGCSTAPSSSGARADLLDEARDTIAMFRSSDPTIDKFFNTSVGYAVFPSIGKGGLVLGGAYGRGALFENGMFTSYCDMSQGTVGLQIGGQEYSEIIFFENEGALSEFKNNAMTFAAQASAVAVSAGVAANRDYDGGVAVFVGDQDGLMAEASIGGQKFSVVSADDEAFAGDPRMDRRPDVYATPNNNNHNDNNYNDKNYNDRNYNNDNYNYNYNNYDRDSGWRNDSEYNRRYDAAQSRVIQGQVTAINDLYPTRDSGKGRQLTIRGVDGQTYTVHLGPVSYLDRSDSLRIREGDRVTVTGSQINHEGQQVIVARDITNDQNQRLELRDSDGSPRWNVTTSNPQR